MRTQGRSEVMGIDNIVNQALNFRSNPSGTIFTINGRQETDLYSIFSGIVCSKKGVKGHILSLPCAAKEFIGSHYGECGGERKNNMRQNGPSAFL